MNTITLDNGGPLSLSPLAKWACGILMAVSASAHSPSVPATEVPDADAQDVAAARRGDGESYARIIRRHQSRIARRMTRFAKDRQAVEELVHDCFVEAYLSLPGYRGESPLEHWLSKIATRVGYHYWKTQQRDRERLLNLQSKRFGEAPTAKTNDSADNSAELAAFLLEQLSPRDRLAITLLHLEGRSVAEAAEMAGWSQTMMKVQAFRARKKLRALLKTQGIDHE